jgi:hypothetical protein
VAERIIKLYYSSNGTAYRVLIPKWLSDIAAPSFGFGADDVTKGRLPRGMQMRYVTALDATSGRHRKIHAATEVAVGWTTLNVPVTLPNIDGTSTVYTTVGQVGEKQRAI